MPVSSIDIEAYAEFASELAKKKSQLTEVKSETVAFKSRYQMAVKTINAFQANLTRISTQICNCENLVDDLTDFLQSTEVPKTLKRQVLEAQVPSTEFNRLLDQISKLLSIAKDFQDRGFFVGTEMTKELDPSVDKAVKRIVNKCSALLQPTKEQVEWLDLLHEDIIVQSKFIKFVEEARPAALNAFFTKYADTASAFYYSCVKGYFSQLPVITSKPTQILIGTALNENGQPLGGLTRRLSNFSLFSSNSKTVNLLPTSPKSQPVPVEFCRLLLRLFSDELHFYKMLLENGHVKRKSFLTKAFAKSFAYGKTHLKDYLDESDPNAALKLMAELNVLEVETSEAYDISTPSQWLSEIQSIVFDTFKRQLRKQIDSLNSFPELKTTLTSSELHHHYVSKRFAHLMLVCLQTLASFQRPWDLVLVELSKLEQAFFSWASKVAAYLRDKKEATIFLLNNIDLVAQICSSLAGADLNASLKFKFDGQLERLVQLELEASFGDLLGILGGNDCSNISQINADLSKSLKLRLQAVIDRSFLYFSNVEVGQLFRRRFCQAALDLYSTYLDYFDRNFGKNALEQENEILPPDLNQAKLIILIEE